MTMTNNTRKNKIRNGQLKGEMEMNIKNTQEK